MKIGFVCLQMGLRATEKTTYSYARYCEELLNHESIIIGNKVRETDSLDKFSKRFKVLLTNKDISTKNNNDFRREIEKIVDREKIDFLYWQIDGRNYDYCAKNCKNLIHYVFDGSDKHGDKYCAISKYLAQKHGRKEFVPYIIDLPPPNDNLRKLLEVPNDAIMLVRTGGRDSFHDIGGSYRAVRDIVNNDSNKFFVFLNTNKFYEHSQIRYIDGTTDDQFISNLLFSSDAFLHARNGETFGLAVGEASYLNKPVISYLGRQDDRAHLDILEDQVLGYNDYNSLYSILAFWDRDKIKSEKYDAYRTFSPENVMQKFKQEFLFG